MPFYEYACESCGHELEELQKINDDALVDCPECNKPKLRKLVSAAAFKLTGTGWYETDFKNNNKPPETSKSEGGSESGSGSSDKSSKGDDTGSKAKKDSKPAKKDSKSSKSKKDS